MPPYSPPTLTVPPLSILEPTPATIRADQPCGNGVEASGTLPAAIIAAALSSGLPPYRRLGFVETDIGTGATHIQMRKDLAG